MPLLLYLSKEILSLSQKVMTSKWSNILNLQNSIGSIESAGSWVLFTLCGSLNENVLIYLNVSSPGYRTVWEKLRGVVLLEEVCHRK